MSCPMKSRLIMLTRTHVGCPYDSPVPEDQGFKVYPCASIPPTASVFSASNVHNRSYSVFCVQHMNRRNIPGHHILHRNKIKLLTLRSPWFIDNTRRLFPTTALAGWSELGFRLATFPIMYLPAPLTCSIGHTLRTLNDAWRLLRSENTRISTKHSRNAGTPASLLSICL